MGRRGYPPEFRRKVLDLLEAGRSVAEVAHDLDISDQSIYSWLTVASAGPDRSWPRTRTDQR